MASIKRPDIRRSSAACNALQAALDLLMSGRLIDATKAKELGLVHSITDGDPMSAAVEFAEQFTINSLPAIGLVREAVLRGGRPLLRALLRADY